MTSLIKCAACGFGAAETTRVTVREIDFDERSDAFDDVEVCEPCLDKLEDAEIVTPHWARVGRVEWSFIDLADEPAHTCLNCDKPISARGYCSTICEGMDKFPAPRGNLSGEPV